MTVSSLEPAAARSDDEISWGAVILRAAVFCTCGAYLLCFVVLAIKRCRYPFELEWMEGGVLEHIRRVADGRPLYVRPTLEFVPFIYTPLYYVVSAGVSKVLGLGFMAPRLVSFACSLAAGALIFSITRRETGSILAGWFAACLYIATYRMTGAFLDIARVDAMFVALFLGGVYFCRFSKSPAGLLAGAACLVLSFMTKQTALLMSLPLLPYLAARHRLKGVIASIAFIAGIVAARAAMDRLSGGWFSFYCFKLPASHSIVPRAFIYFPLIDLDRSLPIALLLAVIGLGALYGATDRTPFYCHLAALVGMLAGSFTMRLHSGGWENGLLPAYAEIAILAGVGVSMLETRFSNPALAVAVPGRVVLHPRPLTVLYASLLVQLGAVFYNPLHQLPSAADAAAGKSVVSRLESIHGDVYIPNHGYLAARAGKTAFAHTMAMADVCRGPDRSVADALSGEVKTAVLQKRFAAIIMDDPDDGLPGVRSPDGSPIDPYGYGQAGKLFDDPNLFFPLTGSPTRPQGIWIPR